MQRLTIHRQAQKDFIFCLCIWLALEIIFLLICPLLAGIPLDSHLDRWFLRSIPIGTGSLFLFALSTQVLVSASKRNKGWMKFFQTLVGNLLAWISLIGIAFPILAFSAQMASKLFTEFGT